MGKNTVEELIKEAPGRLKELYLLPGIEMKVPKGVAVRRMAKQELSKLVDSDSHQGVVAAVDEGEVLSLKEFLKEAPDECRLVMVDSIYDPQNLGSILRAAECFGIDGVIFSKNRGVGITPVVTKVSSGASELVRLFKVSNLAETLEVLKDEGFEACACEAREGSRSLFDVKFSKRVVLILGSEGEGIQRLLSERADFSLMIPMYGKIDSLNVAQAAAVLFFSLRLN